MCPQNCVFQLPIYITITQAPQAVPCCWLLMCLLLCFLIIHCADIFLFAIYITIPITCATEDVSYLLYSNDDKKLNMRVRTHK